MLDGEGFIASLLSRGITVKNKRVWLAGAGGAASAIAWALAEQQVSELIIYNRTPEKSAELIRKLSHSFPATQIVAGDNIPRQVDIAINGTSVGMGEGLAMPFSLDALDPRTLICDIVIFPENTALLTQASRQWPHAFNVLSVRVVLIREYR
ncbi:hypothetical protein [Pantoea sp. B65]|uniref:hypothetical protein n=1 Tax=Pantoea sp. B65 TaxID=2813359 RepID=UPI0039B5B5A7